MKLLIGLGNPEDRYKNNRHNVGKLFIEEIKDKGYETKDWKIEKSSEFMNNSGIFVKKLVTSYQLPATSLYVVHDDLDIPLGQYKIQKGVGPKVHNGINSIESALGGKDFWRIRIGVDNRPTSPEASRAKGEDYVLQDFNKEELEILKGVFNAIVKDSHFPA